MKIGKLTLVLAEPAPDRAELDRHMLAATGCSAEEVHGMLRSAAIAGFVAQSLTPFLKQPPVTSHLAAAIAAAGVGKIGREVRALYGHVLTPPREGGKGAKAKR